QRVGLGGAVVGWGEEPGNSGCRALPPGREGGRGPPGGYTCRGPARAYAEEGNSDRRNGRWLDPDGAKITMNHWAQRWVPTLDVDIRTEENYRAHLRNHILPRWQATPLGGLSALAVTAWRKELSGHPAAATVAGITTVFSMMLDDAVDERLIPTNPVHRRRQRGRRCDHSPSALERVWAMPEHVIRIAEQAGVLGGPSARLLVI